MATQRFQLSERTQPFIAPQHAAALQQSLNLPRPPQVAVRPVVVNGERHLARVFAPQYLPPRDDFNRRVVALGMGRRQRGAS